MSNIGLKAHAYEQDCVSLANSLIENAHISVPRITVFPEINASLIHRIFQALCDVHLPELIDQPQNEADECQNVQAIIDSLSLDVIHMSLSHISGEEIVNGSVQACYDLLEVFHGYFDFVWSNQFDYFDEILENIIKADKPSDAEDENLQNPCGNQGDSIIQQISSSSSPVPPLQPSMVLQSSKIFPHASDFNKWDQPTNNNGETKASQLIRGHFTHHLYHHHQLQLSSNKKMRQRKSWTKSFKNHSIKIEKCSGNDDDSVMRSRLLSRSLDDVYVNDDEAKYESSEESKGCLISDSDCAQELRLSKKVPKRVGSIYEAHRAPFAGAIKKTQSLNSLYINDFKEIYGEKMKELKEIDDQKCQMDKQFKYVKRHFGQISTPIRKMSVGMPRAKQKVKKKGNNKSEMPLKNSYCLPGFVLSDCYLPKVNRIASKYPRTSKLKNKIKTKDQVLFEEAMRKQQLLSNIMKKDIDHSKRLKDLKSHANEQRKVKSRIQDGKIQSARLKRKIEEFESQQKSLAMNHQHKDYMLLKNLFDEGLNVLKKRLQQSNKTTKECKDHVYAQHKEDINALENFYRNYFDEMMSSMVNGRTEMEKRKKAQAEILRKFKQEYQQKIDEELNFLNQLTLRKSQDIQHFREVDVQRFRDKYFKV